MKKTLFTIVMVMLLCFASAKTATAQNFSLNVSSGLSWLNEPCDIIIGDWVSGRLGTEITYKDYVGLSFGWRPTTYPISHEKINSFTFGATGYTPRIFNIASLYGTLAYSTKAYRYEYAYYNSDNVFTIDEQLTAGVYIGAIGIKLQYKDFPLYIKGSYGYGKTFKYDSDNTTYEIIIGLRIFKF